MNINVCKNICRETIIPCLLENLIFRDLQNKKYWTKGYQVFVVPLHRSYF